MTVRSSEYDGEVCRDGWSFGPLAYDLR
jgi:hypothetical protein